MFRHAYNPYAFAKETPESAYWIGFLMADGSIWKPNNRPTQIVDLSVQKIDIAHLEKYRMFLESGHKVIDKGSMVRLAIASNELAYDLSQYGVVPRKSRTAKVIGLEGNRDFWRGVIDGDGSLFYQKESYPVLSLVGSQYLLSQFRDFAQSNGISSRMTVHSHGDSFCTRLSGKNAVQLTSILYEQSCTFLDRKYNVYQRWVKEYGT